MIPTVIDTNILVSALRVEQGNEAAVLAAVGLRRITPCLSKEIVAEYDEVLRRPKFAFDPGRIDELIAMLQGFGLLVAPTSVVPASPDPDDTKFIACAVIAGAAYLVTGNRRHFPEARYGTAEVVTARELLLRLDPP